MKRYGTHYFSSGAQDLTMSEQDLTMSEHDLTKLLQEHDLSPDKWVPLFHNEGLTTAQAVTANISSDELFESMLSEADTEEEKRGLRKLLNIHKAACSADSEIEEVLVDAGLEPTARWLSIFKMQLGVRTLQGLQHIGSESYADLEQFAHKPWEKKALRKLLGMVDEETAMKTLREKQKEKLRQREEKSKQILEKLKDLLKQGKDHHDESTRQLMEGVQEALQIPEDSWIGKDSSPETLFGDLKAFIEQLDGQLKTSRDLSDAEILQHASGGRALQGVLVSKNLEDQLKIRENLLSIPQDVQFHAPSLSHDDKIEEFSSQLQEDQFTRSMDTLGYSATTFAQAGFMGFGFQVSALFSKTTEEERTDKHHQKEMYCSTIKYSFMPMASFHFKGSQLKLSADALEDLKAIEKFRGSQTNLQEQCEHFFHKYGSHAYKGQLHFGGIYWLKCYSYSFHESDLAEVKKLQIQAISASVGLLYNSVGASLEGNVSKLKTSLKGDFNDSLVSKTTVEVTKMGGPQAACSIPHWKSGLVASNFTWNVIDRGSNIVPVWEIIQVSRFKCIGCVKYKKISMTS